MAEYIEREALLKDIEEERPENWTDSEAERQAESDFYKYKGIVEIQPTADVVEVVRCKDCKHSTLTFGTYVCDNIESPWYNDEFDIDVGANDFCSYGEKKG